MKRYLAWAKLLGLGLFVYILSRLDYEKILTVLRQVDITLFIICLLLAPTRPACKAIRWHYIQRHFVGHSSLITSLYINFETLYLSFFTPGRIGDVLKIFLLKQYSGIPKKVGLTIYTYDRIQDILFMIIVSALGMVFIFERHLGPYLKSVLIVLAVGYTLKNFLLRWVAKRFGIRQKLTTNILFEAWMFALNSLIYALNFFQSYLLAQALGIKINYFEIASVQSLGSIINFLPISVSGLGVREGVYIFLLKNLGITSEQAVTLSIFDNVLFVIFTVILLHSVSAFVMKKYIKINS